ncbi:MAG: SDR family oxidoreductase [Acidobacteria bacterium]|nr:SDR family oxidoreductase [Acidobacteriota bacterium]
MSKGHLAGRRAVVTGASSGIGAALARRLAAEGADVVLVARREERLRALAEELVRQHRVAVEVKACDLARPDAREALFAEVNAGGAVDVLVNNAGFGVHGAFLSIPWERERELLEVDVAALVHLTKLFGQAMTRRGFGRILQVSSIGAFQPTPTYAVYGAAKAFVQNFGEAIDHEMKGSGVRCTVLAPGVTTTEFHQVAGQKPNFFLTNTAMAAEAVADIAVRGLLSGRRSVVPGIMNTLTSWFVRLLPRRQAVSMAARLMAE